MPGLNKIPGGLEALKRYLTGHELFKPQFTEKVVAERRMSARDLEKLLEQRAILNEVLNEQLYLDQPLFRGIRDVDTIKGLPIIGGEGGPASFSLLPGIARAHAGSDLGPILKGVPQPGLRGIRVPEELNPYEKEVILHPDSRLLVDTAKRLSNNQQLLRGSLSNFPNIKPDVTMWKTGGLVQMRKYHV